MKKLFFSLVFVCFAFCSFSTGNIRLTYGIKYGIIPAGEVTISYGDTVFQNRSMRCTKATAQTAGFLKTFFNVNNQWESFYDKQSALPFVATYDIKEGKNSYFNELSFDQKDLSISFSLNDSVMNLPAPTYDLFSILYFLQRKEFDSTDIGTIIEIPCVYETQFFMMRAKYAGIENIQLAGKLYRCHKISPGGKTKQQINIWLTDDEKRIPVYILIELPIANLKLELQESNELAESTLLF